MKLFNSLFNKEILLTPQVCVTVSLLYIASVDGKLEASELLYISGLTKIPLNKIDEGAKYIHQSIKRGDGFYDFLKLSDAMLNTNQKKCLVLNLLDIAHSDGTIHQKESRLIKEFCSQYKIENEEIENYKHVISIKNNFEQFLNQERLA